MKQTNLIQTYQIAREQFAAHGVDTDAALQALGTIPISLHCWQGDDVGGFETPGAELSGGGIQATGNYPGKARTIEELRSDLKVALRMIPGKHRLNLHASYLENGGKYVERDAIEPRHFQGGGEEYATSGNQGLLDTCDGLKWVHDNIEAFGGDPANVMIFGESGGGAKTSCLYAMPTATPYFNKASIESGPGIRMMPRDAAAETTLMTLKQLGIDKSDWRKLLEVPVDQLMTAQTGLGTAGGGGGGPLGMNGGRKGMGGGSRPGGFGPVVDGSVLPQHPFDPGAPAISKDKPVIVGSNRDETVSFFRQQGNTDVFNLTDASLKERLATSFGDNAAAVYDAYRKSRPDASPSELYVAITTARMIGIGAMTIAERKHAQHGAAAYLYVFKHASDALIPGTQFKTGTPHAAEIPYKFYNVRPAQAAQPTPPAQQPGQPGQPAGPQGANAGRGGGGMTGVSGPEAVKAAHNMAEMWSTFARTGHPAAKGQPDWPAYTTQTRATMEIDAECTVANDLHPLERALWERLDP